MNVSFGGNNGTVTGTTTAAYVVVLTVKGNGGLTGKTVFKITNTGASKDLKYKIDGYLSSNPLCAATAIKAETTLGETAIATNTDTALPYAVLEVSIISAEAEATTYQVDYMVY